MLAVTGVGGVVLQEKKKIVQKAVVHK